MARSRVSTLRKHHALFCLAIAACSAGHIPLGPKPTWATQQPIAVVFEHASTAASLDSNEVRSGTRSHLIEALLGLGFVVVDKGTPDVPVIWATAVERTSLTAEIRFSTWTAGTIVGDASDCTSAAWGVVADDNERCLAHALATQLVASPVLPKLYEYRASRAAQPALRHAAEGSLAGCTSDRECKAGRSCDLSTGTCVSR